MSMIRAFSLLKDVKPYKQGWRVQVKLLHSWRQKTNYGGDTLEMIFADESGVKIHCSARKSLIQTTQSKLRLGEWRLIETFSLSHTRGQYRPTDHTYKMSIIEDSSIDQCTFECDDEFFNFQPFEKIGNGSLNAHFLIDVIGRLSCLKDIHTVQVAGNDKKKIEFRLTDTEGESIACCLWGKYAEQLDEHLQKTNNPNTVCMICFAKIGFYKGDWQITNAFDSSLICFDPDIPECHALKKNAPNDEFAIALNETKKDKCLIKDQINDWSDVDVKSISEIIRADQIEDPDDLPQAITNLVGSSFCFGLTLGSENVKNGSDIFLVSQVMSGDKIFQIESSSEPVTHVSSASSIMSGGEFSVPEKNEANSSETSSTPYSKRKEKDQVDQTSTSKKLCTKAVKMEKIKDD
ncbi:hypothetical protein HA466_0060390 [Hirschfeldia incana]|nr:hypothetical protein HA466_0154130 [Hirschfeldia incana]KAJ0259727.1 hypothetical protein HA466_0060390 [Hirschfeldia incana]